MKLFALLTKEMRLRLRRERTVWVLVIYILLLGLLAWFPLSLLNSNSGGINAWSTMGSYLYHLLILVQLLLILFITPAFTSTAVNGEKERQTFDLLLCSRLSSFSLVFGKLFAGLTNALLLIAAALPLFSLVFFFGGVSPQQILLDLLTFVITAVMISTFGLFCSVLFPRPAVSTAITYMTVLLWLVIPLLVAQISPSYSTMVVTGTGGVKFIRQGVSLGRVIFTGPPSNTQAVALPHLYMWNPLVLLNGNTTLGIFSIIPGGFYNYGATNSYYQVASLHLTPWVAYAALCLLATLVFFLLSLFFVKPHLLTRIRILLSRRHKRAPQTRETQSPMPA